MDGGGVWGGGSGMDGGGVWGGGSSVAGNYAPSSPQYYEHHSPSHDPTRTASPHYGAARQYSPSQHYDDQYAEGGEESFNTLRTPPSKRPTYSPSYGDASPTRVYSPSSPAWNPPRETTGKLGSQWE